MDFQYDYSTYTQDDFYHDQGAQHFTLQSGGAYFQGVDPTTDSGNPELFNHTALLQFLPDSDIPVFHPVPPQGYQGMTLQDGAVYFDIWPQGPVMFPVGMDQQLQVPLVAMGGASPQFNIPVSCAPHLQAPIIYVDATGQQLGTAVPFDPQLQAPLMLVEGGGLGHGATVHLDPLAEPFEPMDTTDVEHSIIVSYSPVPAPSEPAQLISDSQLSLTEQLAPGYSSTGLMTPPPLTMLPAQQNQVQTMAPTAVVLSTQQDVTTNKLMAPAQSSIGLETPGLTISELMKLQMTTSTVVAEAIKTLDGQIKTNIEPLIPGTSYSQDSLVVELHGAMENNEAKASDNLTSTLVELSTAPVEADTNLPNNSLPVNAEKGTKRKRQINKSEEERSRKRRRNTTGAWTAVCSYY